MGTARLLRVRAYTIVWCSCCLYVQCDASIRACTRMCDVSGIVIHTVVIHMHDESVLYNDVLGIVHIMQPVFTNFRGETVFQVCYTFNMCGIHVCMFGMRHVNILPVLKHGPRSLMCVQVRDCDH